MSQVVGQGEVTCKGVGEGVVEVEDFEQSISLNRMQITVGQSTHVGRRLTNGRLAPEMVSEDISSTCYFRSVNQTINQFYITYV